MAGHLPRLTQVNLVVRDMHATLEFYRQLGLATPEDAPISPEGIQHVAIELPSGFQLEFDNVALARIYNAGWRGTQDGARVVFGFSLPSREAVDHRYAELTAAGYTGQQPPYDAFWGARYAIVLDPDGHAIGLMSPVDAEHRSWPPSPSPAP